MVPGAEDPSDSYLPPPPSPAPPEQPEAPQKQLQDEPSTPLLNLNPAGDSSEVEDLFATPADLPQCSQHRPTCLKSFQIHSLGN
jgi:hypothetical protein